jgi:hypothetical protein
MCRRNKCVEFYEENSWNMDIWKAKTHVELYNIKITVMGMEEIACKELHNLYSSL